jgi:hypothetical protein
MWLQHIVIHAPQGYRGSRRPGHAFAPRRAGSGAEVPVAYGASPARSRLSPWPRTERTSSRGSIQSRSAGGEAARAEGSHRSGTCAIADPKSEPITAPGVIIDRELAARCNLCQADGRTETGTSHTTRWRPTLRGLRNDDRRSCNRLVCAATLHSFGHPSPGCRINLYAAAAIGHVA